MGRIRVAAIIIQDHKLLLLKGKRSNEFWTPGGGREEGETDMACLKRELQEELMLSVQSALFFGEYKGHSYYNPTMELTQRVYIVNISGTPRPSAEIGAIRWLSKEEYYTEEYAKVAIPQEREKIFPELIRRGVW